MSRVQMCVWIVVAAAVIVMVSLAAWQIAGDGGSRGRYTLIVVRHDMGDGTIKRLELRAAGRNFISVDGTFNGILVNNEPVSIPQATD